MVMNYIKIAKEEDLLRSENQLYFKEICRNFDYSPVLFKVFNSKIINEIFPLLKTEFPNINVSFIYKNQLFRKIPIGLKFDSPMSSINLDKIADVLKEIYDELMYKNDSEDLDSSLYYRFHHRRYRNITEIALTKKQLSFSLILSVLLSQLFCFGYLKVSYYYEIPVDSTPVPILEGILVIVFAIGINISLFLLVLAIRKIFKISIKKLVLFVIYGYIGFFGMLFFLFDLVSILDLVPFINSEILSILELLGVIIIISIIILFITISFFGYLTDNELKIIFFLFGFTFGTQIAIAWPEMMIYYIVFYTILIFIYDFRLRNTGYYISEDVELDFAYYMFFIGFTSYSQILFDNIIWVILVLSLFLGLYILQSYKKNLWFCRSLANFSLIIGFILNLMI